ncbi:MAG: hypothetical protein WA231_04185 [Methylocella sp.]
MIDNVDFTMFRLFKQSLRGCVIVVFAVCVILLENIGSVAKKRVEPQSHAQQSQQQSEADKRGTLDAPFIIKPLPAEKNQQEADEDARDKNDKRWNDRITIFVSVVTAIILVFQLIVFGWQAHRLKQTIVTMKELGEKQSKDMQASIAAAQSAANAARDQVSLSREALIMTERAFVFCERIEHFWRAKKETEEIIEWIFFPVWKNSGNTPTKHGMGCVNTWLAIDSGDLPHDFTFPDYGSAERIMIGPGLTKHGLHLPIPIATMHRIREGTAHAYMWGWAEYNTIFTTDTLRHRSEFCLEIQVTGNPTYKEGGFVFRAHGPFNGFDDECYRKAGPYTKDSPIEV